MAGTAVLAELAKRRAFADQQRVNHHVAADWEVSYDIRTRCYVVYEEGFGTQHISVDDLEGMRGLRLEDAAHYVLDLARARRVLPRKEKLKRVSQQSCAGCGAPIDPTRYDCAYCRLPIFATLP